MAAGKTAGNMLTAAGLLMTAAGLGLLMFNINSSNKAGEASVEAVNSFIAHAEQIRKEPGTESGLYNDFYSESRVLSGQYSSTDSGRMQDAAEEKYFEKDGISFLAVLAVPAEGIEIPVCSTFSMELLKSYPCRYSGTAAENSLVIAAHNYDSHFGRLKNLQNGDEIIFTDAGGNVTVYTVAETEVLPGTAVNEMKTGEWDLTLFTCDLSGRSRITVRCVRK